MLEHCTLPEKGDWRMPIPFWFAHYRCALTGVFIISPFFPYAKIYVRIYVNEICAGKIQKSGKKTKGCFPEDHTPDNSAFFLVFFCKKHYNGDRYIAKQFIGKTGRP